MKPSGLGVNPRKSDGVSQRRATLGFLGRPRWAEQKQVNTGVVSASAPLSELFGASPSGGGGVGAVDLPSRWHELQFPLPLNRSYPAFSSPVSVYLFFRNASNFDEKALTCTDCS